MKQRSTILTEFICTILTTFNRLWKKTLESAAKKRRGERIVEEEVDKFVNWTRTLESTPTIVALREKLEAIRTGEMSRLNGRISKL